MRLYIDHGKIPDMFGFLESAKTGSGHERDLARTRAMAVIAGHSVLRRFEECEIVMKWGRGFPIFIQFDDLELDMEMESIVLDPRLKGAEDLIGLITIARFFHMPPDRQIAIQRFARPEEKVFGIIDYEPTKDGPRRCKLTLEGHDLGRLTKFGMDILTGKIEPV